MQKMAFSKILAEKGNTCKLFHVNCLKYLFNVIKTKYKIVLLLSVYTYHLLSCLDIFYVNIFNYRNRK